MEEEAFDPNLRFKEVATDLFEKDKAVVEEKVQEVAKENPGILDNFLRWLTGARELTDEEKIAKCDEALKTARTAPPAEAEKRKGDANVHCDEKGRAAFAAALERGRACEAKLDRLESINDLSRAQATDDEGALAKEADSLRDEGCHNAVRLGEEADKAARRALRRRERDDAERAKACDGLEAKFQKRAQGQSADEAEKELGQLADLPIVYDDGKGIAAPGQVQTNDQAKKTITAKECPNFDRFEALVADKKARETAIEEKRKACEAAGEKAALALDASNVPSDCENRAAVEADVRRAKAACAKDWAEFKRLHDGVPEAETRADFATDFAESRCPPSDQDLDEYLEAQQRAAAKRKERDDAQRAKACDGLEAKFQKRAQGQSADEAEKELGQLADLPIVYDDGKGIAAPGQVQTNDQAKKTITAKECPNFDRFEALVADKKARETAIEEKRKACEAAGEKAALALDASNVPSDCENRAAVEADVRRAKAACAKDWAKFKRLHDGAPEAETRADFATDFAESRCPPSDQDLDEYLEAQQRAAAKRKERDDAQRAKACEGLETKFQKRAQDQSADEADEELGQLADLPIVYDDGKGIAAPGQVQTNDQAKKTIAAKECPNFDRLKAVVDNKYREEGLEMWRTYLEKTKAFEDGKAALEAKRREEEERYASLKEQLEAEHYGKLRTWAAETLP